jgi:hypothetical protein
MAHVVCAFGASRAQAGAEYTSRFLHEAEQIPERLVRLLTRPRLGTIIRTNVMHNAIRACLNHCDEKYASI